MVGKRSSFSGSDAAALGPALRNDEPSLDGFRCKFVVQCALRLAPLTN